MQEAVLLCDCNVKSVMLRPLPRRAHGDTGTQAAAAAAFVRRLQPQGMQLAVTPTASNVLPGSGTSGTHHPEPGPVSTLSLGFKGFTPSELAEWLQGPFGSGPPLPAVGQLAVEQETPQEGPILDSSLLQALVALVPNIRHASLKGALPVELGPVLARHCRQLTSLELHVAVDLPQPDDVRPDTALQPGSISSINQLLSGLAPLPSLESLTFIDKTNWGEAPISLRPSPLALAGPATLRTLVWNALGWDWQDTALMQRVSAALPHLASLEHTCYTSFRGDQPHPEPHLLRGSFASLTQLTLSEINSGCWAHALAHLPALRSVRVTQLLCVWGNGLGFRSFRGGSLPLLPHVQELDIHMDVSDAPQLWQMLPALPQLQQLRLSVMLSPSCGGGGISTADQLSRLPLQLQELSAVLASHTCCAQLKMYESLPGNGWHSEWPGVPSVLSMVMAQWPALPWVTALDASSVATVQQQGDRVVSVSSCSTACTAAELAALLKRCLPNLQSARLGRVTPDDDADLPRTLLELAMGLPEGLHTLSVGVRSGLAQAQLQGLRKGLLQGLAGAGRSDLVVIELKCMDGPQDIAFLESLGGLEVFDGLSSGSSRTVE